MQQNVAELSVMDRAYTWFEANRKQVIWGAGAVLVVGLATAIYFWRASAVEVSASDALSRLEAQLAIPGTAHNESPEAYLKVADEHAGTKAAARALLRAGAAFFAQGKYAEAQTQFQRFTRDYPDSPYRPQAALGNAACLDALGKADEAAGLYKTLSEQNPNSNVGTQAKFALARIYEAQGKLELARALYEELGNGNVNNTIGNEAGLRAEELRAKLPPPAAAPTTTITPAPAPLLSTQPVGATNQP